MLPSGASSPSPEWKGREHRMADLESLEKRWKQASEVAFASIGQPDRAENVAYRDELAAELNAARAAAGLGQP